MSAVELPWRRRKREREERREACIRHDSVMAAIVLSGLVRDPEIHADNRAAIAEGYAAEVDEIVRNLWNRI